MVLHLLAVVSLVWLSGILMALVAASAATAWSFFRTRSCSLHTTDPEEQALEMLRARYRARKRLKL